jgi:hypothetical protein
MSGRGSEQQQVGRRHGELECEEMCAMVHGINIKGREKMHAWQPKHASSGMRNVCANITGVHCSHNPHATPASCQVEEQC